MNIKEKLQALLTASNTTTGETDATLTDAVQRLVDGYGGGGGLPFELESVTEYVHAEDWTTDAMGNAEYFANVYCNRLDITDRRLYVCYVTNNNANQNYRANFMSFQRYSEAGINNFSVVNVRNNWSSSQNSAFASRSFYLSAGSIVKVFVFKFGGIS